VTVYLTVSDTGFSPNGTGRHEELTFDILIPEKEGISKWNMDILNKSGSVVRTYTDERLPTRIIWDGLNEDGIVVNDGLYKAIINLDYHKGSKPSSETSEFIVDTAAPDLRLGVTPKPFSPDNDGVEDELIISPSATDLTSIVSWELGIYDRQGSIFKQFNGEGEPSERIVKAIDKEMAKKKTN